MLKNVRVFIIRSYECTNLVESDFATLLYKLDKYYMVRLFSYTAIS